MLPPLLLLNHHNNYLLLEHNQHLYYSLDLMDEPVVIASASGRVGGIHICFSDSWLHANDSEVLAQSPRMAQDYATYSIVYKVIDYFVSPPP